MGRTKAVLVAVAVTALLAACGSSGDSVKTGAPDKLPIAVGGAGAEDRGDASTAMMPYENRRYVAGKDLPALTGPAAAYRLRPIDRARAVQLAAALGLGDLHDENGSWTATDGSRRLDVTPSGQWSYGSGDSSVGVAVSPDGTPSTTVPPSPSFDDVNRVVDEFLAKAGIETSGAATVEGTYWLKTPAVEGVPADGFGTFAGVDPEATEVQYAGGWLSTPEKLGDYDRIGVAEAVRLLNEGKGHVGPQPMMAAAEDAASSGAASGVRSGPADGGATEPAEPAPSTTACPPDAKCAEPAPDPCTTSTVAPETTVTMPPPQDITITITDAQAVLLLAPSWDGKTAYLVPAYRLHDDRGGTDVVLAIGEDLIQPPPSTTVPPDSGTGKAEPGSTGSGAGSSGSTGSGGAPTQVEPAPPATEPGVTCP